MGWTYWQQWLDILAALIMGLAFGGVIGWHAGQGTRDDGLRGAYEYTQERWVESDREATYYRRQADELRRELAAERGGEPDLLPPQNLPLTVEEAEGGAR